MACDVSPVAMFTSISLHIFHAQHIPCSGGTKLKCLCLYRNVLRRSLTGKGAICSMETLILFQACIHHNWWPLQDMWGSQWCANDQARDRQSNYLLQTLPLYIFLNPGQLWDPVHHRECARTDQCPQTFLEGAPRASHSLGGVKSQSTFKFPFRTLESCWK